MKIKRTPRDRKSGFAWFTNNTVTTGFKECTLSLALAVGCPSDQEIEILVPSLSPLPYLHIYSLEAVPVHMARSYWSHGMT